MPLRPLVPVRLEPKEEPFNWYIINTYHTLENRVKKNIEIRAQNMDLRSKLVQVLVPTEELVVYKNGKKVTQREKLFPGYMIVYMQMNQDTYNCVQGTTGVSSFVTAVENVEVTINDKFVPVTLTEEEIDKILKYVQDPTRDLELEYHIGDWVQIIEGPMENTTASVTGINSSNGTLSLKFTMMGTEVSTQVPAILVEKV